MAKKSGSGSSGSTGGGSGHVSKDLQQQVADSPVHGHLKWVRHFNFCVSVLKC